MTLDKKIFDIIYHAEQNIGEKHYSEMVNRLVNEIKQVYDKRVCANCECFNVISKECKIGIMGYIYIEDVQSCLEFTEKPDK